MNKVDMINKVEEMVNSYREQLEKNDGSSLSALFANAKSAYHSIRESVVNHDKAKAGIDSFKEHLEKLEDAAVKGDKSLSSKALGFMEDAVAELKKRYLSEDDEADAPAKDAAPEKESAPAEESKDDNKA